jgi:PAS domain S-box-containing protein
LVIRPDDGEQAMSVPGWWLLDESPTYIAILDNELICRELSRCWRARLGIAAADGVRLALSELLGDAAGEEFATRFIGILSGDEAIHVRRAELSGPDGNYLARLSAWRARHPGDDSERLVVTVSDTTDYEESLRELADVQSRHELILAAAGEGVYGLDGDGNLTFGNDASRQILGWEVGEILGQKAHDVHHHSYPDGSPYAREKCPIYAALKDGEVHRVDSEVFWHVDGSPIPVEYTSTPILEDGKPNGAVVVFRDISRRLEAEQQREAALKQVTALKEQLEQERDYLRDEIEVTANFGEIIGESPALKRTLAKVEAVAATDANVLVLGESGVGKEMIARAIHSNSQRCDRPLIKVNCASIPRELFESEFFGHVKGAFTGAHRDRVGRMQLANCGTLFLDEVGEIPLELQGKLLRALQEQEFERVGDDETISVDVRIVAATNKDLEEEVASGRFREDLYYRLSVFPMELPPLRERVPDIVPLAMHFIGSICAGLGKEPFVLTKGHCAMLQKHRWPGNVRELRNVIERAVILTKGSRLRLDLALGTTDVANASVSMPPSDGPAFLTEAEFRGKEKENLIAVLRAANWRVWGPDGAAAMLGIKPSTLAYRMNAFGIEKE